MIEPITHRDATPTDEQFWRLAYREHAPAVHGFLRARMRGDTEADDLLQETFVRAIRAGSFRTDGNLRAYLMQTARNLLINRARRPRLVVPAATGPDEVQTFDGIPDVAASPEQLAALGVFRRRLAEALATLSDDHRTAFELGIRDQRSYREISTITGWTVGRVKINVHRARKHLIRILGDVLPDAHWRTP